MFISRYHHRAYGRECDLETRCRDLAGYKGQISVWYVRHALQTRAGCVPCRFHHHVSYMVVCDGGGGGDLRWLVRS
jgi:hypothetical protein